MITGFHTVVYSSEPDQLRALFGDGLGFSAVDIGHGWQVFKLPPAELAVHPSEQGGKQELYLTCDDIKATVAELKSKGVDVSEEISDEGWGLLTTVTLPGGVSLGLYEPRHQTAH